MQRRLFKPKKRGYKKNPYRRSKVNFLRPYIPRGIYWSTFKFRGQVQPQCDANGTIAYSLSAWGMQGNQSVVNLAFYYEAFKIVYTSYEIQMNQSAGNNLGGTPLMAAITHVDLTSILQADIRQRIMCSRQYISVSMDASNPPLKLRWLADPTDGDENQFTRVTSPAGAASNGGLLFYFDGPATMANTYPITITQTFYCILRGQGCSQLT